MIKLKTNLVRSSLEQCNDRQVRVTSLDFDLAQSKIFIHYSLIVINTRSEMAPERHINPFLRPPTKMDIYFI